MRIGPVRSFWLSFFLTLAVVLPVLGGFVLYGAAFPGAEPAEQRQPGVPVEQPGPRSSLSLLAVSAGEDPAFLLLRLDAQKDRFALYVLPKETAVLAGDGSSTLAESYAAAGPARAARQLSETLAIPELQYLAAAPEVWARAAEAAGTARVNLSGLLTGEERLSLGWEESVLSLTGPAAAELLRQAPLMPPRLAALRAAVWQAFLRQNREALSTALPETLRQYSSRLLTDLDGRQLHELSRTLEFLADAEPEAQLLPGLWQEHAGRYELNGESRQAAQALFGPDGETQPSASPHAERSAETRSPMSSGGRAA